MYDETVYIKLMAEFTSSGVWNMLGSNVEVEDFDLAPEIVARIKKWCEWYETNESYRYNDEEDGVDPFDYAAFAKEGLNIARHIKAAHPDWTVMYFDEWRFKNHLEASYEVK